MESAERRPDPARETGQSTRQKGPERAMEQGVEARTNVRNQQVAGSSPASSSIEKPLIFLGKSRVFLFSDGLNFGRFFGFWRPFGVRARFFSFLAHVLAHTKKKQAAGFVSAAWSFLCLFLSEKGVGNIFRCLLLIAVCNV